MVIDNVMYHNIDDIMRTNQGIRLLRFNNEVLNSINPHARFMARAACNSEIRFCTPARTCFVSLMAEWQDASVVVYYGDYVVFSDVIKKDVITKLTLSVPEGIEGLYDEFFENNVFKAGVWRIHLSNSIVTVCDIDTMNEPVRIPNESELPKKTMLSYGSSISHGAGAIYNPLSYVNTLARLLKTDCMAKGVGGACFTEKIIANDFKNRGDWDFGLFELGINMIDRFSVDEFKNRFEYFADAVYSTGKKAIFLTIFPCFRFYRADEYADKIVSFNDIIRKKCESLDKNRVLLVEGADVLTDTEMLTSDGIHPSTEGHAMMGYNLFELTKSFING